MAEKFIGQGPGNLVPDSTIKTFLAGEAISKGECVSLTTALGPESYTVSLADQATGLYHVVGVAKSDIAAGEWGIFYTKGYCPAVLSGGSVAAGDFLIPHTTAGTAVSGTVGTNDGWFFGVALSADTGDPIYCDALLNCYGS